MSIIRDTEKNESKKKLLTFRNVFFAMALGSIAFAFLVFKGILVFDHQTERIILLLMVIFTVLFKLINFWISYSLKKIATYKVEKTDEVQPNPFQESFSSSIQHIFTSPQINDEEDNKYVSGFFKYGLLGLSLLFLASGLEDVNYQNLFDLHAIRLESIFMSCMFFGGFCLMIFLGSEGKKYRKQIKQVNNKHLILSKEGLKIFTHLIDSTDVKNTRKDDLYLSLIWHQIKLIEVSDVGENRHSRYPFIKIFLIDGRYIKFSRHCTKGVESTLIKYASTYSGSEFLIKDKLDIIGAKVGLLKVS